MNPICRCYIFTQTPISLVCEDVFGGPAKCPSNMQAAKEGFSRLFAHHKLLLSLGK